MGILGRFVGGGGLVMAVGVEDAFGVLSSLGADIGTEMWFLSGDE